MRRICRRQESATAGVRRRLFRQGITAAHCLAALVALGSAAGAQKGEHSLDATVLVVMESYSRDLNGFPW